MRKDKNPAFIFDPKHPRLPFAEQLFRLDQPAAKWTRDLASISALAREHKCDIHAAWFSYEELAELLKTT